MIGTSDGQQFDSSFEHTVASTMPPGGPEKAAGALNQQGSYQGSGEDLLSPVADKFGRGGETGGSLRGGFFDSWDKQFGVNPDKPTGAFDPVNPYGTFNDEPTTDQKLRNAGKIVSDQEAAMKSGKVIVPDQEDMNDHMRASPSMENLPSFLDQAYDIKKGQPGTFSLGIKTSLPQPLISVLSHPDIANAIANPKIDRDHEVPYVAGASSKPNDFTTHVDKSVPSSVTISGKTFDPAIPLNIHEQVEKHVMEQLKAKGMTDEKAYEIAHHEFAEVSEDAWYKANGIDVKEANKFWSKIDQKTEKDKGDFPKDLYKAPYPHDKVEGVKHEPSGVSAEWAMGKLAMDDHPTKYNPAEALQAMPGTMAAPQRSTAEAIHSAALRTLSDGKVHIGVNHGEAYMNMQQAGSTTDKGFHEGFVTTRGRFVDRKEAGEIAAQANQVDKSQLYGGRLLSEHLPE